MNHKDWKNKALFGRLLENFGYEAPEGTEEELEEQCPAGEDEEELMEGDEVVEGSDDLEEKKIREAIRKAINKTLK